MQLWSAAIYVQCVVEGFLGLDPLAHAHAAHIFASHYRATGRSLALRNVEIGEHRLDIQAVAGGCTLHHVGGPQPLRLRYGIHGIAVTSVEPVKDGAAERRDLRLEQAGATTFVCFDLIVGDHTSIAIKDDRATLRMV